MPAEFPNPRAARWPTWVGLALAFLGPTLGYYALSLFFGLAETPTRLSFGLVIRWLNFAALVALVVVWERRPIASIGLRRFRWWTIPLGVAAGVAVVVATPLIVWLNRTLGLSSDQRLVALLFALAWPARAVVVLTAAVVEEALFRGYAFERLAELTGHRGAAAVVTFLAFTAAHIPAVGLPHLLPVGVVGALVTVLYLWRRDLVVNIVAHFVIDGIALLVVPAFAHPAAP